MNKKVISFSVYINLGELQNCPAFLMHKQALEKRWHLGGMEAQASNSALRDHYVFHVARACLCCIGKQDNSSLSPTSNRKEEKKMVKLTPPMGWNSWNTFGEKINESLIKETADCMAASGLKDAGYDYLVIDDCWSLKERDAQGRLVADPAKFPNGMKAVADYVHSKGLKFGMYSCAGNLTCAGYPGSYEHEFTDAETFASWGADETHEWMKESSAGMWRSTGDIFDTWESVKDLVHQQEKLLPYNATGCFNDMDMRIVGMYGQGNVGLKGCNDTHYSIWALLGSPLMIGCDIRNMNDATRNILMNRDLIAINQDAMCRQAVKLNGIWAGEDMVMYSRNLSNGDIAIGLFNLSENKSAARFNLDELGLPQSTGHTLEMTEVWTKKTSTVTNGTWIQELDAYDCAVYRAKVVKA